jgi:hypothetical protein
VRREYFAVRYDRRILISLFSQPNDGYLRLKLKQDPQDLKSGKDPRLRMGSTLAVFRARVWIN